MKSYMPAEFTASGKWYVIDAQGKTFGALWRAALPYILKGKLNLRTRRMPIWAIT